MRKDSPGCALAMDREGLPPYTRGYGMANLEDDVPIGSSTVFDIGSVSKQFTAAVILQMATEGRLSLDDGVRSYVPEVPDYGHTITLRHLLHHTSGLRDYTQVMELAGYPRSSTAESQ
ncbi:MAG: serine hydrolase domain-containing protein [Gemmatimonadaceae bacterium]